MDECPPGRSAVLLFTVEVLRTLEKSGGMRAAHQYLMNHQRRHSNEPGQLYVSVPLFLLSLGGCVSSEVSVIPDASGMGGTEAGQTPPDASAPEDSDRRLDRDVRVFDRDIRILDRDVRILDRDVRGGELDATVVGVDAERSDSGSGVLIPDASNVLPDAVQAVDAAAVDAGTPGTIVDASRPDPWPRSAGCSLTPAVAGVFEDQTLNVGGTIRVYDLYVPSSVRGAAPLVFNMHGWNSNENQQISTAISGARAYADRYGYILVAPRGNLIASGMPSTGSGLSWNGGDCCIDSILNDANHDDVGFIRALAAHLFETQCIDRSRVYATGFSNGGYLSHRLACEAGDLFAAAAPVAGPGPVHYEQCLGGNTEGACNELGASCAENTDARSCKGATCTWAADHCVPGCVWSAAASTCNRVFLVGDDATSLQPRTIPADGWSYSCPARANGVPVIMTMGTLDPQYNGGHGQRTAEWGENASFAETAAFWQQKNGCSATPTRTVRYECEFNAACAGVSNRLACGRTANCTWSGDACHSICDQTAGCNPIDPMSISDVAACRMNGDQATCDATSTCRWNASRACTDCRDLVCTYYENCGGNAPYAACVNEGGTHCWPGSEGDRCSVAQNTDGTPATINEISWTFMSRFQLPAPTR